ncbi:hypothetical protein [Muricauda sp. MAR_2010_75]|uniref:hypothetical protein n=1 Tax=Allomuricauda sp. MAR_2010_75 TaxID=1250232 RepID=UPI0012E01A42|nr:hypothetical protein [Muricauda sp. MAR_2010_75]
MKIKVYKTGIMVLATLLISACSQKQGSSVKDMLEDHSQQEGGIVRTWSKSRSGQKIHCQHDG